MTTPWPTENPNNGPLWVQWNLYGDRHALLFDRLPRRSLRDDEAEAIARQLGQPLPRQTEMARIDQLKGRVLAEWPDDRPCSWYLYRSSRGEWFATTEIALVGPITVTDDLMVEVLK